MTQIEGMRAALDKELDETSAAGTAADVQNPYLPKFQLLENKVYNPEQAIPEMVPGSRPMSKGNARPNK